MSPQEALDWFGYIVYLSDCQHVPGEVVSTRPKRVTGISADQRFLIVRDLSAAEAVKFGVITGWGCSEFKHFKYRYAAVTE